MTITTTDARKTITVIVLQVCPLCGAVLDPGSHQLLCPDCEADEAEKWADYRAGQEQARHPY